MSYHAKGESSDRHNLKLRDDLSDAAKTKEIIDKLESLGCKVEVMKQRLGVPLPRQCSTPRPATCQGSLAKFNLQSNFSTSKDQD